MFKLEFVNKDVCLKLNKLNFGQFKEELFNNIQFDSVNENGDIEEIQKQYDLLKQFSNVKKNIIFQKVLMMAVYSLNIMVFKDYIIK
jgi:hypothetical protein